VERQYRGATYKITIRNPHGVECGRVELTLDGKPFEGNLLPASEKGKIHQVIATLCKA